MSVTVPNRTLLRAPPRAGSENLARRVDRRSYASCVVPERRKCRESRHQTRAALTRTAIGFDRGQQFSITAMTNGGGSVVERYAYSAYGTPTITDGAGVVQAVSSEGNRYLYTGREWDEGLSLYHYRARMHDSVSGRFVSRDPIGYWDSYCLYESNLGLEQVDPTGLACEVVLRTKPSKEKRGNGLGRVTVIAKVKVHFTKTCVSPCSPSITPSISVEKHPRWDNLTPFGGGLGIGIKKIGIGIDIDIEVEQTLSTQSSEPCEAGYGSVQHAKECYKLTSVFIASFGLGGIKTSFVQRKVIATVTGCCEDTLACCSKCPCK